jgi:hypothetical protein
MNLGEKSWNPVEDYSKGLEALIVPIIERYQPSGRSLDEDDSDLDDDTFIAECDDDDRGSHPGSNVYSSSGWRRGFPLQPLWSGRSGDGWRFRPGSIDCAARVPVVAYDPGAVTKSCDRKAAVCIRSVRKKRKSSRSSHTMQQEFIWCRA